MTSTALLPVSSAWQFLQGLVLDAVSSAHSKRAYSQALTHFFAWYEEQGRGEGFTKAVVQRYRSRLEENGLAPSTINVRLAAIRKLAVEAADNGLLAPEAAISIGRVKGAKHAGRRAGNWLTRQQAEQLLALPDTQTNRGKRDRALLCLLVGCGLRRTELAALTLVHLQQREGRWVIVDLVGKGSRVRSVPMPAWAKAAVDSWTEAAQITSGSVLRPVNKGDRITGESMTAQAVFEVVRNYGEQLGVGIRPHDLRRTFAKLAHTGRAPLEQIQLSLGHASVQTTERYLGLAQDLTDAPCDHLGLHVK